MKASIYIPVDKEDLYREAKKKLGDGVSSTFIRCIQRELEELTLKTGRIVVEITSRRTGVTSQKAFEGLWLIANADGGEEFWFGEGESVQGKVILSVAKTVKGRIVILEWIDDEAIEFEVYEDLAAVECAKVEGYPRFPKSFLDELANTLGVDRIEVLDI